jgi:hypothetical protein
MALPRAPRERQTLVPQLDLPRCTVHCLLNLPHPILHELREAACPQICAKMALVAVSNWAELPEDLMLRVLEILRWKAREMCAVRGSCRRWRDIHDPSCKRMRVRDGVSEKVLCSLCGRLPALTSLVLEGVQGLTLDGLSAVGRLPSLTYLTLHSSNVTNAGLHQLRDRTSLTTLSLSNCSRVTDHGMRELSGLTALTTLYLADCSNVTKVDPGAAWLDLADHHLPRVRSRVSTNRTWVCCEASPLASRAHPCRCAHPSSTANEFASCVSPAPHFTSVHARCLIPS